ncbi:Hypothetical predicted protein [Podarcis lilfordi]|uniref:Uncharacterized protein n=1 Tax=Podarcis lilfordi TaxID=74358 RepID=A0AA35P4M3_9SAUR|nr:Hypothetical predicted protein [Podarcis lilfordi]
MQTDRKTSFEVCETTCRGGDENRLQTHFSLSLLSAGAAASGQGEAAAFLTSCPRLLGNVETGPSGTSRISVRNVCLRCKSAFVRTNGAESTKRCRFTADPCCCNRFEYPEVVARGAAMGQRGGTDPRGAV